MRVQLLLLVLLVSSCSFQNNSKTGSSLLIDLSNPKENLPISSFIEDIETIKFEVPEPYFFGIITKVLFTDSTFFVVDKKQGYVYRFRQDGTFLNQVGSKGEAPGKYRALHRFFLGKQSVFISDIGMRKIHCYTHSGGYIQTISATHTSVYDDIIALPNGKFLCHDIQGRKGESKIWLMNEKGEEEKTLIYHDASYPYSSTNWSTIINTSSDDSFKVFDPITGVFYLYEVKKEGKLVEMQHLVSDRKALAAYKGMDNLMDIRDDYAYLSYIADANRYLYTMWYTSDSMALCSLYEKDTMESTVFYLPKIDFPGYPVCPIPIATNLPNVLVTVLTDEYPLEYFPKQYKDSISERVAIMYLMNFKK